LAKELPASALADERLAVYGAVKAAYGLGDPITTEGRAKNLKGAIRQIIGTVPKFGMFQSKVISKTQDSVGRSVTIPDKNLGMDQIGIPEDMAWTMYRPHVERKLIQRGYSPVAAKEMIEEKNATARHILEDAMEERPVLMDRAPTWHKFNILAFRPHIVEGRSIHVCPLIDSGFNMDHDGDTVNLHVPAGEKAAKQAFEKMLPSKNLISLTDLTKVRYKPEKEQISGLWALTRGRTRKPTRYFSSKAEAIAAYRNGEIGPNDPVEIKGE
jgi:DNA-directed RNA polymerase subunit beta'